MVKLPVRTWILNAAAVLSGQHGDVTRQAEQAGCSRETVYRHARKVESRLAAGTDADAVAELREENQRLRDEIAGLRREADGLVRCDRATQRRLATTAFAMGVSLRQIEDLLALLLPAGEVPDHSTLGHWVGAEARRAGEVLKVLDPACAPPQIHLTHAKGQADRYVPILPALAHELRTHLQGRTQGYLFESNRHTRYAVRTVQTIVKRCAAAAGITKRVHPHLLRHSVATILLDSGQVPIDQVRKFLGHLHLSTTQATPRPACEASARTMCGP